MRERTRDLTSYFKRWDEGFFILVVCIALLGLGLVVLSSATHSFQSEATGLFGKQVLFLIMAVAAGLTTLWIPLERLRQYTYPAALVMLLMLLLVLIPGLGVKVNGARRWLDLGLMRLQVSEFAKITLVLALAKYLADNQRHLTRFVRGFVVPCGIIGVFFMMIIAEPDFGTAFLCGLVGASMIFLAGTRLAYLLPCGLAGLGLFGLAVFFDPVRFKRITSFLDVEANRSDGAYQLWQGLVGFGSGGVDGVGLGNGRQHFAYLPEAHTDFIFPIIGEEMGLIFTLGIVLLFGALFVLGVRILKRSPDMYNFLLILGALTCIVFQALINMGVVTGLLPTKGMSLPFISYGGSNLVAMFILLGIILNVCIEQRKSPILAAREL